MMDQARDFAIAAHGDQLYGGHPYGRHLADVVANATRFGGPDIKAHVIVACWLHDTVEDTDTTLDDVRLHFGKEVAGIVDRVTDPPGLPRRERHKVSWPRIAECPDATFVKLCDRVANMEFSLTEGDGRIFHLYCKEYPGFRGTLFGEDGQRGPHHDAAWEVLDWLVAKHS